MRRERLSATARVLCLLAPTAVAAVFLVARVVLPWVWADPRLNALFTRPCLLRATTGIPCPFCGGTRAAELASRGRWLASLRLNPLGTLVVGGGPLLAAWLLLCAATGRDLGLTAVGRLLGRRIVIPLVFGLLTLLWAWQIAAALWLWPQAWQGS